MTSLWLLWNSLNWCMNEEDDNNTSKMQLSRMRGNELLSLDNARINEGSQVAIGVRNSNLIVNITSPMGTSTPEPTDTA